MPNVYGQPRTDAEQALIAAGFAVRSIPVCSASVGRDIVRQVLYEEKGTQVIVVDKPGISTNDHAREGTELTIKIGTGQAC